MNIRHIVAAADESEAGRQAVRAAVALAVGTRARVTVMRAIPTAAPALAAVPAPEPGPYAWNGDSAGRLQAWVEADVPGIVDAPSVSYGITQGLPGVEIGRFAERIGADLVVVGRKVRSRTARVLMGDTADAVARRSTLPCLFVTGPGRLPTRVLAAVDGTERGETVLGTAADLAEQTGASLRVVTVERIAAGEPVHLAAAAPSARAVRLAARVQQLSGRELDLRHGDPVAEVLAAVGEWQADVLVVGHHRGGPPGIIEAGSVARQLAHAAPCSVLTVPL
jgi:nucleotide-binding universal stress UspA family protein